MKSIIYVISSILIGLTSLKAQQTDNTIPTTGGNPNTKSVAVGNAIQKFKTSEFMVRFSDFKNQMETDARDFIARQNAYSPKDVRRVQMAYDKTSAKFNQIMLEIKQDFMDKEKIKMINKFPDMYSNGLKGKIDNLEDFYKANFQQTLADVTEKDGSALLLVLVELIKAAGELSQHFKTMKFEKEYMNDQYIQQNLVAPSRLPSWTELSTSVQIRTDVISHPSRSGNANNQTNNGNGNNTNGNNNGGTNNGGNNNGGTNNGGNNNGNGDNGGNNNGNGDNGGNNNGNGDNSGNNNGNGGNFNSGGLKRVPKATEEVHNEKIEVTPDATQTEFGVEGKATIKPDNSPKNIKKTPTVNPNTEGVKKTVKKDNGTN